jgi:hypothetical protein
MKIKEIKMAKDERKMTLSPACGSTSAPTADKPPC